MQDIGIEFMILNILIMFGFQQVIDFIGRLFFNDGDVVICESLMYLVVINVFKFYNVMFVEVDMDEDGMIMEELEKKFQENLQVKFIYMIFDF